MLPLWGRVGVGGEYLLVMWIFGVYGGVRHTNCPSDQDRGFWAVYTVAGNVE